MKICLFLIAIFTAYTFNVQAMKRSFVPEAHVEEDVGEPAQKRFKADPLLRDYDVSLLRIYRSAGPGQNKSIAEIAQVFKTSCYVVEYALGLNIAINWEEFYAAREKAILADLSSESPDKNLIASNYGVTLEYLDKLLPRPDVVSAAVAVPLAIVAPVAVSPKSIGDDDSDEDQPIRRRFIKKTTSTVSAPMPPVSESTTSTSTSCVSEKNAEDDDYVDDEAVQDMDVEDDGKEKGQRRSMNIGMPTLSREQRELVLELHEAGGHTHSEIAKIVGCTQGHVSYIIQHPDLSEKIERVTALTQAQNAFIEAALRANVTYAQMGLPVKTMTVIAEETTAQFGSKVWKGRVNKLRNSLGIETKVTQGSTQLSSDTRLKMELSLKAAQTMFNDGFDPPSIESMAQQCGVNQKAMSRMKKDLGLTFAAKAGGKKNNAKRLQIAELLKQGQPPHQIKKELRCGQDTIKSVQEELRAAGQLQ